MVELIISEKPSSAQKIAVALADKKPIKKKFKQSSYYELNHNGKKIIVTSAVGHLYGIVENNKKGWNYPVFDIKWETSYKQSKELKYIKKNGRMISMDITLDKQIHPLFDLYTFLIFCISAVTGNISLTLKIIVFICT